MKRAKPILLHALILMAAALTMVPFVFALNNSFRTTVEAYHSFFGFPRALEGATQAAGRLVTRSNEPVDVVMRDGSVLTEAPAQALRSYLGQAVLNYQRAWTVIRPYMLTSLMVCVLTALGVALLSSVTAYVLSRQRFPGSRAAYYFIISAMMFPGVLIFVPAYLLVRELSLLNSMWAMVLPYAAGGQVIAIFVLKSFFDGLPEDLFEAARIDGAGHLQQYRHIVLPLSKPVLSVVLIMNVIGTWNNFLWPFVTQPNGENHVIASGLYVLATTAYANDVGVLFAAYMLSSIPLLVLFVYATRPFIEGVTSGAFKA